jgi:hypothetical protein
MLLNNTTGNNSSPQYPFRYARVLGIYHVNAIYVGPGMVDYQPYRLDFLWVRWFRHMETTSSGWTARKLDRIQFLPVVDDGAFGFVNPAEILRSCHVIPRFAKGQLHSDGKGLSGCAQDSADSVEYYVGR